MWESGKGPCTGLNPDDPRVQPSPKRDPANEPPKGSRGLGDTIAKFTHATGIAQAVEAVSQIVGVPCGCNERQQWLNEVVPYRQE